MDLKDRKKGDVLTYDTSLNPYANHAREGIAVVREEDGKLIARDTFWNAFWGMGGQLLTPEELESAEYRFNHGDYRIIDRRSEWLSYDPKDRRVLTEQHRHRRVYLVREGARPSLSTQIDNARAKVAEARSELQSAEWRLESRQTKLNELLAKAGKPA